MTTATQLADDLVGLFANAERSALFCDFDGTLSDVVAVPEEAVAVSGAVEALTTLAGRLHRVAIVSGRPLAFLEQHFPAEMDLVGLYGVERRIDGVMSVDDQVGAWSEAVADVVAAAAKGPEKMRIEDKGLSLTLHYREHPEIEDDVKAWAVLQAKRSGLHRRDARKSQELHPPISTDKGTAVADLAKECGAAVYVGDDVGDLPAFDALKRLSGDGVAVMCVVVEGQGTPRELADVADVVVSGPEVVAEALAKVARRV